MSHAVAHPAYDYRTIRHFAIMAVGNSGGRISECTLKLCIQKRYLPTPVRIAGDALWGLDSRATGLDDLTPVFGKRHPWVQIRFRQSLLTIEGIIQRMIPSKLQKFVRGRALKRIKLSVQ